MRWSIYLCECVSLFLWAVPVFLHCDPTGPQLSPGNTSPTGYPHSLLSWPERKTDRWWRGGVGLFLRACSSVCTCDHRSDNITPSQRHVWQEALTICTVCTYREEESVFEVGELSVTLLAAVQSIMLVYDLLVAVCSRTGLVQTTLLTNVQHRRHAAEIVRLRGAKVREEEQ